METIEDGIYFGMPETPYHATPHIGSSKMKLLYASPSDYWFESHMNPMREPDKETFAQSFGHALHHRILYGEAAFKKDFLPTDEQTETGEVSAEGFKSWIIANGGTPGKTKDDNARIVSEDYDVKLLGSKTYAKIAVSAQMILKNPNLAQAFVGGWPEVSVFWHQDGVPCKARFDYLKKRVIVDLKSFRSKERISSLDRWVLQDLFNYRYDIQAAHYLNGHAAMKALVEAGKVFAAPGASRPTDEWLASAAAEPPNWVFVFFKADGMPVAKSYQIPYGSPAHQAGKFSVLTALASYKDHLEKFGTDAWVNLDEPFQITEEDVPKWL